MKNAKEKNKSNKKSGIFNYDNEIQKKEKIPSNKKKNNIRKTRKINTNKKKIENKNLKNTTETKNKKNARKKINNDIEIEKSIYEDIYDNINLKDKNNKTNKKQIKSNKKLNNKSANNKKNKKLIKSLEKRKKKELKKKLKEIEKKQKSDEKQQNKKMKRKLNQKQIQQIHKVKVILKNAFLVILIVSAIFLFLLSPIFNIKEIKVVGNENISKDKILSLLMIDQNTNIFEETTNKVAKKLKENAYVESVTIKRILPSTLQINIKERKVQYLLEFGSSYAYIDDNGNILEISINNIGDKLKITGYQTPEEEIKEGNKLIKEDIEKLKGVVQIIKTATNYGISDKITAINIKDENNYVIFSESERKTIYFGDKSSIDTKILYIKAIMEKESNNEGEIFVNIDLNKKNPSFKQKV